MYQSGNVECLPDEVGTDSDDSQSPILHLLQIS